MFVHYVYCYKEAAVIVFVSGSNAKTPDASIPESYHSKSDEEEEEILGSDDDEQEDPQDYCKGKKFKLSVISYR